MKNKLIEKIFNSPDRYGSYKKIELNKMSIEQLTEIIVLEDPKSNDKPESKKTIPKKNTDKDDYIVTFKNIKKSFGTKKVHKGVTFNIKRGETLALIGANGAGKTVLMETLVRVQRQDSGHIEYNFNGTDPFEEIGMQFQDADSNSILRPLDMIKFIKKMYGDKVDNKQLEEMIDIFGVRDYIKTKIKKLSGGQKQRVNLLLATMHNPSLMILDEFITGLDVLSVRDILDYISFLKEKNNATLVIISHQPEEIKSLAQRVIVLKDGVIANELTHKEIDKEYKGKFTDFLIDNI